MNNHLTKQPILFWGVLVGNLLLNTGCCTCRSEALLNANKIKDSVASRSRNLRIKAHIDLWNSSKPCLRPHRIMNQPMPAGSHEAMGIESGFIDGLRGAKFRRVNKLYYMAYGWEPGGQEVLCLFTVRAFPDNIPRAVVITFERISAADGILVKQD